ncbi:MAG: cysteine--tRNA ligase [Candidatus Liptonbacteria bacterium]|nr:cysteine--tRNA ligase [Candidatus Liptonbacteria bacterium]
MLIYNTLTGKKEVLRKTRKAIKLFVCGPTVYDDPHLGHARTYIFFDIVARYLVSRGYKVRYLQNITDIDDRIILRAREGGIKPQDCAKKFEKKYLNVMQKLGVASVSVYARATDHIPQIISQIKILIQKGHAYEIENDGIYFDVKSFRDYGKLSRRTAEQAEDATSRIDDSIKKRNRGDFTLWKFRKAKDEPSWKSPWGDGRPGWHIEDTAITEKYFGPQYDLHGGGLDLKFPHHEAEIAQAESAFGKIPFVKIWMHTGFLLVNGKKMSKSLGNFITIEDFLKKYSPETLRFLTLTHHYRSPINYSEELTIQYHGAFQNLLRFLGLLKFVLDNRPRGIAGGIVTGDLVSLAEKGFHDALQDDFNTPAAVAHLFNLINNIQQVTNAIFGLSRKELKLIRGFIESRLAVLGFAVKLPKIAGKINKLAKKRELFRVNKQFAQSDRLRKKIDELGYMVEDTPIGQFVWPK